MDCSQRREIDRCVPAWRKGPTMNPEWLHWYYLIYLLPAGVAVLVLLTSGLGGHHGGLRGAHGGLRLHLPHVGGHHGGGPTHALHGGAAHPTAHAGPTHGGTDSVGHGHAGHSHGGHSPRHTASAPPVGRQLLGFFGIGRAPLPIVLGSLMIGWGFFGLAATETLRSLLRLPALFVLPSMAIAAGGALATAKLFAELSARLMPKDETYAISREGLLGLTGKVIYPVSATGGRIHIYDQYHTLHVASARIAPGSPPIERGAEVIVASADPDNRYLIVEPLGFSKERPALS
jgi:membrane protein implicated in regulation of membrane protease activity